MYLSTFLPTFPPISFSLTALIFFILTHVSYSNPMSGVHYVCDPEGYLEPKIGNEGAAALPATTIINAFKKVVENFPDRPALCLKRPVNVYNIKYIVYAIVYTIYCIHICYALLSFPFFHFFFFFSSYIRASSRASFPRNGRPGAGESTTPTAAPSPRRSSLSR